MSITLHSARRVQVASPVQTHFSLQPCESSEHRQLHNAMDIVQLASEEEFRTAVLGAMQGHTGHAAPRGPHPKA